MTNYDKYEKILLGLDLGKTQSDITMDLSCSYGTITRAKKWALDGKPRKNIKKPKISLRDLIPPEISSENEVVVVKNSSVDKQFICSNCGKEFETYYDGDGYQTGVCVVCLSLREYGDISSSEVLLEKSSSENIVVENSSSIIENAPKSRLLSYLAGCLDIKSYWNMSKKQLKNNIINVVEKI